jgi:hypothetical protein
MEKKYRMFFIFIVCLSSLACGSDLQAGFTDALGSEHPDESPIERSPEEQDSDNPVGREPQETFVKVVLASDSKIRFLKKQILEVAVSAPAGTELAVPVDTNPVNFNYRKDNGQVAFSSTGFYDGISILKSGDLRKLSQQQIEQINQTAGGLYVSATINSDLFGPGEYFVPIRGSAPGSEFLQYYETSGRPKFSYSKSIRKRFGDVVNRGIPMSQLPAAEQAKWTKLMNELRAVATRTQVSLKKYLSIDKKIAEKASLDFEQKKIVPVWGAWSVAVLGTATRHGFSNVPCAEFMSEVLRQAYKRAGLSHFTDFNANNKNILDYANGAAAVANFSLYLSRAGFVPWDSTEYAPPTGAFLMNGAGNSPGHTYIAAGEQGKLIVDNGSPKGRDLRATSARIIGLMYQTGVFFLPPGFIPEKW